VCVNEREQVRERVCVYVRESERERERVEQKTEGARHTAAVLHQCSSMCSLTIECVLLL